MNWSRPSPTFSIIWRYCTASAISWHIWDIRLGTKSCLISTADLKMAFSPTANFSAAWPIDSRACRKSLISAAKPLQDSSQMCNVWSGRGFIRALETRQIPMDAHLQRAFSPLTTTRRTTSGLSFHTMLLMELSVHFSSNLSPVLNMIFQRPSVAQLAKPRLPLSRKHEHR